MCYVARERMRDGAIILLLQMCFINTCASLRMCVCSQWVCPLVRADACVHVRLAMWPTWPKTDQASTEHKHATCAKDEYGSQSLRVREHTLNMQTGACVGYVVQQRLLRYAASTYDTHSRRKLLRMCTMKAPRVYESKVLRDMPAVVFGTSG